ncbi:Uncharacterised protein [Nocardia brasiliensis]|nr:Uncharacterised protein [Nocardia brasiliensis]
MREHERGAWSRKGCGKRARGWAVWTKRQIGGGSQSTHTVHRGWRVCEPYGWSVKPAEAQRYPHPNRGFLPKSLTKTAPQPDDHAGTRRHGTYVRLQPGTALNALSTIHVTPAAGRRHQGCPASAASQQAQTQQHKPNDEAHHHFGSQPRSSTTPTANPAVGGRTCRRCPRPAARPTPTALSPAIRASADQPPVHPFERKDRRPPPGRRQKMGCGLQPPPRTVIRVLGDPEREDSDSRAECWCATCEYVPGR